MVDEIPGSRTSVAVLVVVVIVLGVPVAIVDVIEVVVVGHRLVATVHPVHVVRVLWIVMPMIVRFAAHDDDHALQESRDPQRIADRSGFGRWEPAAQT